MFQKLLDLFVIADKSEGTYSPTTLGNIALVVIIILIFIAMMAITGRGKKKLKTKELAFAAVAMTLAVVTSFYAVYKFPFGGSITLFRMFFICLIGYLYGPKIGIMTGISYGLLDLMLEPYVIHPVQMFLDYPIAFGCLGLSGLFTNSKYGLIKGYTIGVLGRFICHVISGVIFFSADAGSQNVLIYSLIYNAGYILPEAALTIIVMFIPAVRNGLMEVKRMAIEA